MEGKWKYIVPCLPLSIFLLGLTDSNSFYYWITELQLELYFADDAHTLVEFYSPRNELEALNFIVSLIDTLLSTCKHLHTNVLLELKTTILGLISDFGDKNGIKAVVERDHICNQEVHLLEWGKSNGVRTQLQIACKFHHCSIYFSVAILFVLQD